jgi:hypothetical protein
LIYDTNYWKSCCHARLAVATGDRGGVSLFGEKGTDHRLFVEHLTAEYPVKTAGRGRTVDEWKERPGAGQPLVRRLRGVLRSSVLPGRPVGAVE